MKKTKESIIAKWEKKKKEVELKEKIKLDKRKAEISEKCENEYTKLFEKCERKSRAYINRKVQEYDRKCKNEIRKIEGKEERVYKVKEKKLNKLDFALSLLQENSKLRDTNSLGLGYCCSCNGLKQWGELAGGHRYSRGVKNICLDFRNINAQCHSCNFTTGPRGNPEAKDRTNYEYDKYLDKKYGEGTAEALHKEYVSYFSKTNETNGDYGQHIDLDTFIEEEIGWNEGMWKTKDFYKPGKKWREIWETRKQD